MILDAINNPVVKSESKYQPYKSSHKQKLKQMFFWLHSFHNFFFFSFASFFTAVSYIFGRILCAWACMSKHACSLAKPNRMLVFEWGVVWVWVFLMVGLDCGKSHWCAGSICRVCVMLRWYETDGSMTIDKSTICCSVSSQQPNEFLTRGLFPQWMMAKWQYD